MNVIVAYGTSVESNAALAHGVEEAMRRQAQLHVLTSAEAKSSAQERLESAGSNLPGWVLHESPASQSPAHAVLDVAEEVHAEVIVVGARRRSPAGKFILGSLAQEILLGAEVPVLLVRP